MDERTSAPAPPVGSSSADVAGGLVEDVERLRREIVQLQQAMLTRAVIDQAKGILMHRFGLDAVAAFRLLARWSSVTNIRVVLYAEALVELTGGGSPSAMSPDLARHVRRMLDEADGNQGPRSLTAPD